MQRSDGGPKQAPSREEYEERLAACEAEMLRQASDYRVATAMEARFGVARRTAQEWIRRVRESWAKGASPIESVEHNATKQEARARFLEVYRLATCGVWSEPSPDDPDAQRRMLCAPNLKVAGDTAQRLAQLDGHLTPKGPPVPPPEKDEDPVVAELRAGLAQVEAAIRERGVDTVINERPEPGEEDLNPRAALKKRNEEIAALKARVAELEAAAADG